MGELSNTVRNRASLSASVAWVRSRSIARPSENGTSIPLLASLQVTVALTLGLYGNILVVPSDPDYWPPVDREVVLTVDDLLLEDGAKHVWTAPNPRIAPHGGLLVRAATASMRALGTR